MKITPSPRSRAAASGRARPRLFNAQRGGRLVENQHSGTVVGGSGDGNTLPLATESVPTRLIDVTDVDAHGGHLPAGNLARGRHVETTQRTCALGWLGAEEEVPPHGHQRDHREVLVDRGDAAISASRGEENRTGTPSMEYTPSSGGWTPTRS
jgi:hypothetical protein